MPHVPNVVVLIPRTARRCEWMFPAEVDADDLIPVIRDRHRIAEDCIVGDREHATRAHARDTFGARLALVLWIGIDDRLTLFGREVLGVVDLHAGDVFGHVGNASQCRQGAVCYAAATTPAASSVSAVCGASGRLS